MKILKLSKAVFVLSFFLVGLYSQAQIFKPKTKTKTASEEEDINFIKYRSAVLSAYEKGERNFFGWNLKFIDLRLANLIMADLKTAILIEADLRGAILIGADLTGADLTGGAIYNDQTKWP